MTGQDLLQGLSFVDERFIAEADTAVFYRKIPWMKVLSVAACLCILIVGAFALENLGFKGAKEEAAAPAAAAPEAMQESATEAAPPAPEECITEEAVEEIPAGELQHIPHATLRIVKRLEDGSFEAIALATEPMEMDTSVTLVIDPDKVPDGEQSAGDYEETITEDMVVQIRNGAYDAGSNTLYVEGVFAFEE